MNRRSNAMVAAACLAVVTAQATDFTYIGGDGDLSSSDVWGGSGVPGSADKAFITGSGNWALTLSEPFAAGLGSIYPSKDGPLSVTINTGTSGWIGNGTTDYKHPFLVNGTHAHPASATLRGAYSAFSMLYVGCGIANCGAKEYSNSKVEITGSGTTFTAAKDDTLVGGNGTNNTLIVSGGAHVTSGRALVLGGAAGGGNTARITGDGTRFIARGGGDYTKIGNNGSQDNTVIVENGARFEQTTSSYLAIGCGNGATRNAFIVRDGGVVDVSGANSSFYVGMPLSKNTTDYSFGNRLVVTNASFSAAGLYVGNSAGGCSNRAEICGGSFARTAQDVLLGGTAESVGNELRVVGEGTVLSNVQYDVTVGKQGAENRLQVADGAKLYAPRYFYLGGGAKDADGSRDNVAEVTGANSLLEAASYTYVGHQAATGNVLRVTDGGCYTNHNANVWIGGVGSLSNAVEVAGADARFYCGNYAYVGCGASSCHNRLRVSGPGAYAEFARGFAVGVANGACSNVVEILDGAVVETLKDYEAIKNSGAFFTTGPNSTDVKYDDATIVGNGIVVSNATLTASGSTKTPELVVNYRGVGGYLKALDGAVVTPNQSFSLGIGSTNAAHGLIYAAGEGTVLSNKQYHLKVGYGARGGHDNMVWIDRGAKMYIQKEMHFGEDTVPTATNNCLKITNGEFHALATNALEIRNHGRLSWGGSLAKMRVTTLRMTNGGQIDLAFDEDGIAACGPRYESYLLNNDWTPSVSKITIDATAYVKNRENKKKTFTVFKSLENRTIRTQDGTNLDSQSAERIAAVNQAFRDIIVCEPADRVTVTKVDMAKSTIEVEVKPLSKGMVLILR